LLDWAKLSHVIEQMTRAIEQSLEGVQRMARLTAELQSQHPLGGESPSTAPGAEGIGQRADDAGQPPGAGAGDTERGRLEMALRAAEERYRASIEALPQLVSTCQADGTCDYLSPQWLAYTGIPEQPQLGYGWLEQVHPDDRQRTRHAWSQGAPRGDAYDIEFRIPHVSMGQPPSRVPTPPALSWNDQ
jgi:PAS domain-containing protein